LHLQLRCPGLSVNQRRPRSPHTGSLASARSMRLRCAGSGFGGGCSCGVSLAIRGAGCASSGMVLPMIGMVRTGCRRWCATGGSFAFAAAPTGALFLAGDCTTKAVTAIAQQMAATTTAKRGSRWTRNGSCSCVITWELGQPASRISVPMAGSLFVSGTCPIGSGRFGILRACL